VRWLWLWQRQLNGSIYKSLILLADSASRMAKWQVPKAIYFDFRQPVNAKR